MSPLDGGGLNGGGGRRQERVFFFFQNRCTSGTRLLMEDTGAAVSTGRRLDPRRRGGTVLDRACGTPEPA